MLSGKLDIVEEGVTTRGVETSGLAGAAILNVLGTLRVEIGWGTEGFSAGKSVGETTALEDGTSEEEDTLEAGFDPTEMFNIPGIDFLSFTFVDETLVEGPVGIFLAVVVGDLIKEAIGVDISIGLPLLLLLSSAGKSSD